MHKVNDCNSTNRQNIINSLVLDCNVNRIKTSKQFKMSAKLWIWFTSQPKPDYLPLISDISEFYLRQYGKKTMKIFENYTLESVVGTGI